MLLSDDTSLCKRCQEQLCLFLGPDLSDAPESPASLPGAKENVLKPSPASQSIQTMFKAILEPRTFFLNPLQSRTKMLVHDIFAKHAGSGMDRLYVKRGKPFSNPCCRKAACVQAKNNSMKNNSKTKLARNLVFS